MARFPPGECVTNAAVYRVKEMGPLSKGRSTVACPPPAAGSFLCAAPYRGIPFPTPSRRLV